MLLIINENPISEKHVAWFVKTKDGGGKHITLYEVVEQLYRHPQAPDDAVIPVLTTRQVCSILRNEEKGASLVLFEAAQTVVDGRLRQKLSSSVASNLR